MTGAVQSALDPAGPGAARILELFWLFTIVCGLIFVAVVAALLWAAFRRRRERGGAAVPHPPGERRLRWTVGAATGLTVAILLGLLVSSFAVDRSLADLSRPEELTIHVVGHQWWWEVRYEDAAPDRTFATANEIHLPVGAAVGIRLTSPDVIHSFWVPSLHGKMDLIPGRENHLRIAVDRPGTWRGQCAEYCGLQHAHMALLVVAEPREAFEAWRERQLRPAPEPTGEQERRGREAFLSGPCMMCHAIRGTEAAAVAGPDLTHVASRETLAAGMLPNTSDHLAAWIANAQEIKPGSRMPSMAIEAADLEALLAYLETLR